MILTKKNLPINKNNENNDGNIILFDSVILQKQHFDIIKKGLKTLYPNKVVKKSNFKILYRASCDGDTIKTIMELVKNNKQLLVIIKTDKGEIFGAFIPDSVSNELYYSRGFIFELVNKKIEYNYLFFQYQSKNRKIYINPYFYINDSFSRKTSKILSNINFNKFTSEPHPIYKELEIYSISNY